MATRWGMVRHCGLAHHINFSRHTSDGENPHGCLFLGAFFTYRY
jgi:hypothetical protein